MRTCQKCGAEFEGPKRGRPRHYCYACVPRTRALPPDTPAMPEDPGLPQALYDEAHPGEEPVPPEPVDVSEYTRSVNVLDREELEKHEQAVNEATFPPVPMPPEPPVFDDNPDEW